VDLDLCGSLGFFKVRLQCESLKPVIRQVRIKAIKERTVLLCPASHDLINIKFDLEHVVNVEDVQRLESRRCSLLDVAISVISSNSDYDSMIMFYEKSL